MTMKALGMRMGFDEKAASCRIAQWEQGFRNLSPESSESLDETHDANFYGEIARLSEFLAQYWSKRSLLSSGEMSAEAFREWKLHWEQKKQINY